MDPTDVLRTLWQQRWYVLPALVLALAAAAYVYGFAPRSYESTATYALVNPAVPTAEELERDPALAALDADNPYLRSADTNLITDALIARLGAASTVKTLQAEGVGTDYGVGPGVGGNGFVVDITGVGPTPEAAIATTTAVGTVLESELDALQRVNGADDQYLFTPLLLAPPDDATEQFSSRLRAVIVVLIGGAVLVFAAASLGRWRSGARARRAQARAAGTAAPPVARAAGAAASVDPAQGAVRTAGPSPHSGEGGGTGASTGAARPAKARGPRPAAAPGPDPGPPQAPPSRAKRAARAPAPEPRDAAGDEATDEGRGEARDETRDVSRDETRDVSRDKTRDVSRDETRDVSRDKTRDVSRDETRGEKTTQVPRAPDAATEATDDAPGAPTDAPGAAPSEPRATEPEPVTTPRDPRRGAARTGRGPRLPTAKRRG